VEAHLNLERRASRARNIFRSGACFGSKHGWIDRRTISGLSASQLMALRHPPRIRAFSVCLHLDRRWARIGARRGSRTRAFSTLGGRQLAARPESAWPRAGRAVPGSAAGACARRHVMVFGEAMSSICEAFCLDTLGMTLVAFDHRDAPDGRSAPAGPWNSARVWAVAVPTTAGRTKEGVLGSSVRSSQLT
jgi:hypothetical protein